MLCARLLLLCVLAGSEAEYKAMRVLCLVATLDEDPQCAVAAQVSQRRRVLWFPGQQHCACCTCRQAGA